MELATGMAGEIDRAKRVSKSLVFPDCGCQMSRLGHVIRIVMCIFVYLGPRGQLKDGLSTLNLHFLAYLFLSDAHLGVAEISEHGNTKHLPGLSPECNSYLLPPCGNL